MNPCNMFPTWVLFSSQWNNQAQILCPSVLQLILEASIGVTYMCDRRTWYLKVPVSIFWTPFPLHLICMFRACLSLGFWQKLPVLFRRAEMSDVISIYVLLRCQNILCLLLFMLFSLSNMMCLLKLGLESKCLEPVGAAQPFCRSLRAL